MGGSHSSNNLLDLGSYQRVVQRLGDGVDLCSGYLKMIKERAKIEANYAKNLRDWADKWDNVITKGPESARTLKVAWKSQVKEARDVARCHDDCCQKIHQEVIPYVKDWKKENYHRESLVQWKEVNEAKKDFHAAQQPWKTKLQEVNNSKKAYHEAAKVYNMQKERVASAENNPDFDEARNGAWLNKAKEKKRICFENMNETFGSYKAHLNELLTQYRDKYKEDMYAGFRKCQEAERKRIVFLKDAIMKYMKVIDLTMDNRFVVYS